MAMTQSNTVGTQPGHLPNASQIVQMNAATTSKAMTVNMMATSESRSLRRRGGARLCGVERMARSVGFEPTTLQFITLDALAGLSYGRVI